MDDALLVGMKYLFLLGFLSLVVFSCVSRQFQESDYLEKTEKQLIEYLGKPIEIFEKNIDDQYAGYENEPDYAKYFSTDELKRKITIRIIKWRIKKEIIMVWLTKKNNEWLVFSAIKYDPEIQVY
jgi:hypothetical protein